MEQGNASGSASSNSVGMVSTKCAANISQNDQDCTVISQEDHLTGEQEEQRGKRQKVLTSAIWEHFNRIKSQTKEGISEKVVDDGSSTMCDLGYSDWDVDF